MFKTKIITALTLLTTLFTASTSYAEDKLFLFNTVEFKSSSFKSVPKWQEIIDKRLEEELNITNCLKKKNSCPADKKEFIIQWFQMLKIAYKLPTKADQIEYVNDFFNMKEYILDIDNWGLTDYWEIPTEFLEFSGDCEDYAIIKYYTLKKLGFDIKDMRIVVLKDTVRNGAHAVLAVYHDNKALILDNLSSTVLEDKTLTQYVPYYSINENFKWIHFKKM